MRIGRATPHCRPASPREPSGSPALARACFREAGLESPLGADSLLGRILGYRRLPKTQFQSPILRLSRGELSKHGARFIATMALTSAPISQEITKSADGSVVGALSTG